MAVSVNCGSTAKITSKTFIYIFNILSIFLTASFFFIFSLLSYFFFFLPTPKSTFTLLPLLYTFKATIVKPRSSDFPLNLSISCRCSSSRRVRLESKPSGSFPGWYGAISVPTKYASTPRTIACAPVICIFPARAAFTSNPVSSIPASISSIIS